MVIDRSALPPEIRLSPTGRSLTVRLRHGRRRTLPAMQLRSASLSTVRDLVASKTPRVVLAPLFTKATRQLLEDSGWGWIDQNGNIGILGDDLFIRVERPESQRSTGALTLPPQAERIVRHLLDNYPREFRLTEIATETELDKGYTSRMVRRLLESGTVAREGRGPIRVTFPAELFELWARGPERSETTLWFASGSPDEITTAIGHVDHWKHTALTGMQAAALIAPHVTPERLEVFVTDGRTAAAIALNLGAEQVERGSNLEFLVPRDPGIVRMGTRMHSGHRIASISQVYRDVLQRGRGREREAGEALRREWLKW